MILVTTSTTKSGSRLKVKNKNNHPFNHAYNYTHDAKRAWLDFVKQIIAGNWEFVPEKKKVKKKK